MFPQIHVHPTPVNVVPSWNRTSAHAVSQHEVISGLPRWLSGKESSCQCRRHRFDPWVGKISWRRKWQPTLVSLPGKFHGQRSLVGYSPWGHQESDMTEHTHTHTGLKWALNWRLDSYKKSSRDTEPEGRTPQGACCCPGTKLCPTVCSPMDRSIPGFPVLQYFPEFAQTYVHWISDAIQPSHPLLPPSPSIFLAFLTHWKSIRVFSNELTFHIRWPKYWSFSISPSNEYPGWFLLGFTRFHVLVVHGTLQSLLQHHSLKTSILWRSAFFMALLLHPYMTTGRTTELETEIGEIQL